MFTGERTDNMVSIMQIWQDVSGKPSFRIQTGNEHIHQEMLQSDRFELVGWGVNIPLWIYRIQFQSFQNVRQTFERYFGTDVTVVIGRGRS
jgi:hypothetical protein